MEQIKKNIQRKEKNMEYNIKVGISNNHVHLTKETYEMLFDEPIVIERELNQIGEYASKQFVTLKTPFNTLENVRIVGPFRQYNQVELCQSECYRLKINPPVRKSGDVKDSEAITIIGPKGEVILKEGCIIAQRHVHINTKEQEKYGVKDGDIVKIKVDNERSAILYAFVKISDNGFFELHLDRDEANALLLKSNEEVKLII